MTENPPDRKLKSNRGRQMFVTIMKRSKDWFTEYCRRHKISHAAGIEYGIWLLHELEYSVKDNYRVRTAVGEETTFNTKISERNFLWFKHWCAVQGVSQLAGVETIIWLLYDTENRE
jgi:hypothetical protein